LFRYSQAEGLMEDGLFIGPRPCSEPLEPLKFH